MVDIDMVDMDLVDMDMVDMDMVDMDMVDMDMVDMDMDIVVRRNSQLHWSIIGSDMPSALGLVHFLKR